MTCVCPRWRENTSSSLLLLPSWRWHPTMIAGNWAHWHLRCGYQTMPPRRLPSQTPRAELTVSLKCGLGGAIIGRNVTSTGSTCTTTPPHARSASFASLSALISLCPRLINPPLGQSRACWRVKDTPHPSQSEVRRPWLMSVPYGQLISRLGRG